MTTRITPEIDPMAWMQADASASPPALVSYRLCLDPEDGALSTRYSHQCESGTPGDEWHGLVQCFALAPLVDPVELTDRINAGEIDGDISRVVAGYDRRWDGNNHVGRYTDDAKNALDEIAQWLDGAALLPGESTGIHEAGDWLAEVSAEDYGITPATTDDQLSEIADRIDDEAATDYVLLAGTLDIVTWWRDRISAAA